MCYPPHCDWIKCNTHGTSKGNPALSASGGIFCGYNAAALGCFAVNVGITYSLHVELIGAMKAIVIAYNKGWRKLWLESDS